MKLQIKKLQFITSSDFDILSKEIVDSLNGNQLKKLTGKFSQSEALQVILNLFEDIEYIACSKLEDLGYENGSTIGYGIKDGHFMVKFNSGKILLGAGETNVSIVDILTEDVGEYAAPDFDPIKYFFLV